MVKCKICDVRDYKTARRCAELGADFLGLHCIDSIKREHEKDLREISERMPDEFPMVGLVVVTLVSSVDEVWRMARTLRPSHLQLHSPNWTGDSILRVRDRSGDETSGYPKIIAVSKVPADSLNRLVDLCRGADILLLDRTHYEMGRQRELVAPIDYQRAVRRTRDCSVPCMIAGGLTRENVRLYLDAVQPWGVDVQGGVEVEGERGRKDMDKVRAFIGEVKSWREAMLEGERNEESIAG